MFGIPLHPLIVHFPIVLAVLLPISAAVAVWAIGKGATPRRAWAAPVVVALGLALSAWLAVQTGESQENRVERVVARAPLHQHEESAERFLALSGVLGLVVVTGLAGGVVGRAARIVSTAGALAMVVPTVQVGHTGGLLVYRHGAASTYAPSDAPATNHGSPDRPDKPALSDGGDHR